MTKGTKKEIQESKNKLWTSASSKPQLFSLHPWACSCFIRYSLNEVLLKGSAQAGLKWLFRSDFPSWSESAEIWHVYSFCVKRCPCFFPQAGKQGFKHILESSPPPPPPLQSPSNSVKDTCTVFWPSKMKILRCLETDREGGGGGGGLNLMQFCPYVSAFLKKSKSSVSKLVNIIAWYRMWARLLAAWIIPTVPRFSVTLIMWLHDWTQLFTK